jgi:hypothetical protein
MKLKYLYLLTAFILLGCQQEELEILEAPQENASFLFDEKLTSLILAVTAHDGSFDDVVDQGSCFSIDLPYAIELNGEAHQVNTIEDLLPIQPSDIIVPIYPINLNFADYRQQEIVTNAEFLSLISACENNLLFNERIACIDFEFPINIQVYNTELSSFETVIFDHDKKTFESIVSYSQDELAAISFPINMINTTGEVLLVNSKAELKGLISNEASVCN